jgi:acyl carrier protein
VDGRDKAVGNETLRSTVERILRDDLGIPDSAGFDFSEPLGTYHLDSLAAVNIVFDIENEFGIVFPLETIVQSTFSTGEILLSTIERLVQARA